MKILQLTSHVAEEAILVSKARWEVMESKDAMVPRNFDFMLFFSFLTPLTDLSILINCYETTLFNDLKALDVISANYWPQIVHLSETQL